MAFDWLGTALRNEPQPSKLAAVRARLIQLAAGIALAIAIGAYLGLWFTALLYGFRLTW